MSERDWMEIKCINCSVVLAKTPKHLFFSNNTTGMGLKQVNKLTLTKQPIFCFNCYNLRKSGIE